MKAILEFNLPEDNLEYKVTSKANDMAQFIFQLVHNTKKGLFYSANGLEVEEGIDITFQKIYELLNEYDINIDELIL
jgi:hypothetical protein